MNVAKKKKIKIQTNHKSMVSRDQRNEQKRNFFLNNKYLKFVYLFIYINFFSKLLFRLSQQAKRQSREQSQTETPEATAERAQVCRTKVRRFSFASCVISLPSFFFSLSFSFSLHFSYHHRHHPSSSFLFPSFSFGV